MRYLPFILCVCGLPTPAFAHLGHVAEVAGHSHVIAIGATIAAAALAGFIAKSAKEKAEREKTDGETDKPEPEATGESA